MAHLLRVAVALLLLLCGSAHALIPQVSQYRTYDWSSGVWSASTDAACSRGMAYLTASSPNAGFALQSCTTSSMIISRNGIQNYSQTQMLMQSACPANSTASGAQCACNSGYAESGGQCVSQAAADCAALKGKSVGPKVWRGKDASTFSFCDSFNSAGGGMCVVTATRDVGWADASGQWWSQSSDSQYTGTVATSCNGDGGTGTTPGSSSGPGPTAGTGSQPTNTAAPAPCPAGQAPGQVNGVTICAPMGSSTPTTAPSSDTGTKTVSNADGTSTTTTTNGTTNCSGGTCTTTNTVTTTNRDSSGNVTGTSTNGTTSSQSQTSYCQANGKSPQCSGEGDGKGGSFSGDCAAGFKATGDDPILNAMAQEQYRRNCILFGNDPDANSTANKAKSGADGLNTDKMKSDAAGAPVTVGSFDTNGRGWSRSCPADPSFSIPWAQGGQLVIPFSRVCGPLQLLSTVGVSMTLLGCLVWCIGGKK